MPEIRERMPKRDLPSGAIAGTRVVRGWRILDGRGDDALIIAEVYETADGRTVRIDFDE